jgi:hypothetical protein
MRITSLLIAGAAALAIGIAPTASAAPTPVQSCGSVGARTECQSPGNVEITDTPPPVAFAPYGGYGLALGGTGVPYPVWGSGLRGGGHR